MARITVEDCLKKIKSQYDLVLIAKERTTQLNSGEKPLVSENNDKNTVIALREIGEGKISIKTIEDSGINKLRKAQSQPTELDDLETEQNDDFEKIYKGEISKSGAAILPSKRVRKMPEKITTTPIIESTITTAPIIESKKEEKIEQIVQQPENEKNSAEEETK
jgi:DNA-directed RNA polymerase subunit omega